MSRHPATIALAARIRALGPHRASTAADLSALGGDMVSEAPALSVLGRMVTRDERLTAAALAAVSLLARLGPADRPELVALRAALGVP